MTNLSLYETGRLWLETRKLARAEKKAEWKKIKAGDKEAMADHLCHNYRVTYNQAIEILIKAGEFYKARRIAKKMTGYNYKKVMEKCFKK